MNIEIEQAALKAALGPVERANAHVIGRDPRLDGPHPRESDALRRGETVGDAHSDGQPVEWRQSLEPEQRANAHGHDGPLVADADVHRHQAKRAGCPGPKPGPDAGLGSLPLFPPYPNDRSAWEVISALEVGVEPAVRRMVDGLPDRVDRLRTLGNGVVPVVAAVAFLRLRARLIGDAS